MTQVEIRNDFLLKLLALQQDGKDAISAPTNWINQKPILEVSTEIDAILNDLQDAILQNGKRNTTARWHFIVGSPGNGKSAAMGKLSRQLIKNKNCQLFDENYVPITDLEPTILPYAIEVHEGKNKYSSALIVQDASVVRKPFSTDVDPAKDLLNTLEYAWEKGISLVICTNRGVLEKAYRDNHIKHEVNSKPWFKILKAVVKATSSSGAVKTTCKFTGKNSIFQDIKINYDYLDNRSLLQQQDIFDRLIQNAIRSDQWIVCSSCRVNTLCPFKANKEWLFDIIERKKVLDLLTRAEVLSGQIIVFREALAIISLILAGCPKDYDSIHPCEWVQMKVDNKDIFSLISRRIYMNLFTPYSPAGLESVEILRNNQLKSFNELLRIIDERKTATKIGIKHVIDLHFPSTDVGVTRLLSEKGTIAILDPLNDVLPMEFYNKWDSDFDTLLLNDHPFFSEIERACISIWKDLEEALEQVADHSVSEAHWSLRRWSSNFMLHYGALNEGRTSWAKELDYFSMLLGLIAKKPTELSNEDKEKIMILNEQLVSLLNTSVDSSSKPVVNLSNNVILAGGWVNEKLKPSIIGSEISGSVSLGIKFRGGEQADFAAPMYLWLSRKAEGKLDHRCFPQELLLGVEDARVRAASKGDYAVADSDVELSVETGDKESFIIKRYNGDVIVK
jgi:hypothetical protein